MKQLFSFVFLVFFSTALFAQGVDFSGEIETLWGVGAPWTDSDTSAGQFLLGDTAFTGTLDAYFDKSSALVDGSVSYNALSNELDFSVNELWLDYSSSFWGLRIGRQKTAWGKADGIDITNVICPKDMSSFSAMTSDDAKLAVDAIRFSLTGNQFTADTYWIPFFRPSELPLDEDNSLRKYIVPASVDFPVSGLPAPLTVPVTIGSLEKPETAIWNGEYGLKISGYFPALDLSLYGFYGWDDLPLLDYTISYSAPTETMPYALPNAISVAGEYKRMGMIGVDAAIPIKATVLRTEAAFFPQRYFQKSSEKIMEEKMTAAAKAAQTGKAPATVETSEQHNELSALIGLDWMPSGWTITAQYFCDFVFGDLDALERKDAYTHGSTLSLSKSLVNETLELSLSGLLNFNDFDSLINPSVSYSLSDQIKLSAGAYIFLPGPDEDGEYGQYKDLSSIYIKAKFSF